VSSTERPTRQEQEPARDEIDEVAPGILRLQLPIDMPGLGHVNCYLLEDERGVALVDPGLPGEAAWNALVAGLARADLPLQRVHTVIATHSHPDHYGGANRLRDESGADVVTQRAFRAWFDPGEAPDVDVEDLPPPMRLYEAPPWGGDGEAAGWRERHAGTPLAELRHLFNPPVPTHRLDDADIIQLAKRDWVALHTPGHTEDHLCLFDPVEGVFLSGDHVLPTITPHISGISHDPDPLAQFFASLEKVAAIPGVTTVLPAHGHPFADLPGRARAIQRHHHERLDLLRKASAELARPATVPELATHLFSSRAQGPMANSETFAHLEHLRLSGQAERNDDTPYTYIVTG
jgi:glyoxylase-like metal-dependent hydrolase (beta-lactamase superfamily II)